MKFTASNITKLLVKNGFVKATTEYTTPVMSNRLVCGYSKSLSKGFKTTQDKVTNTIYIWCGSYVNEMNNMISFLKDQGFNVNSNGFEITIEN